MLLYYYNKQQHIKWTSIIYFAALNTFKTMIIFNIQQNLFWKFKKQNEHNCKLHGSWNQTKNNSFHLKNIYIDEIQNLESWLQWILKYTDFIYI